ncbi:MAG: polysaccharide biosynthesis C-terminal domain-containing protein [Clostridia bacterium]|nr:polysaccharide biosynthesis C-terminal domain-containing protein [Clostridia bacterium]
MKKTEKFLLGGTLLSATSLLIRFIGMSFNVYVTSKIGSAGMGLISLTGSVYNFAVTFATGGIRLGSTRLCAEAIGHGSDRELKSAVKRSVLYALCFGCAAFLLLFFLARPISIYLLEDERCIRSLKILSPTLPCIAVASALNGYFTAVSRVYKTASATLLEMGAKIFISVNALRILLPKGLEYSCIAVICGGALAEGLSFFYLLIVYLIDSKRHLSQKGNIPDDQTKKLFFIAIPVALTTYVRSGLLTLEHMLIPKGLRKYGASAEVSLATYGTLQAMALPIVLFPMAILSSFTGLVVPEISESLARGDNNHIDRIILRVLRTTLIFSAGCSIIIFAFSSDLGMVIYNSPEASLYVKIFSILIPVMYFDSAVDSLLQGLGYQVYSMKVNIIDAGLSALLVFLILPYTGIGGYVFIVFFAEILNTTLSLIKLFRHGMPRLPLTRCLLMPLICAIGSVCIVRLGVNFLPFLQVYSPFALCFKLIGSIVLFIIFLFSTFTVPTGEISSLFSKNHSLA